MNFVKVPDVLPDPQVYLRVGLPRPTRAGGMRFIYAQHLVGDVGRVMSFVTDATGADARGPKSLTVTNEAGALVGVVWAPSSQYLTYPAREPFVANEVERVERTPSGALRIWRGRGGSANAGRYPPPVDLDRSRIVTIDHSVILAQVDPAKFALGDALFVSTAIAIEMAGTSESAPQPSGKLREYTAAREWGWSTPVPIDDSVLHTYRRLVAGLNPPLSINSNLDRTDLLCAATAILYGAPMYTTHPEAYKGLKNGLKVIEYGPTRSKATFSGGPAPHDVSDNAPDVSPPPPTSDARPATAESTSDAAADGGVKALRRAYDEGADFDARAETLLSGAATGDPEELATTLADILLDYVDNADPTWRIGILERAADLAPTVVQAHDAHADLMSAVANTISSSQVGDPVREGLTDLALAAFGWWGRWPEDASDEVLDELEEDASDPGTLKWYGAYLKMTGVPDTAIATELDAVREGHSVPSRKRLEQLRHMR